MVVGSPLNAAEIIGSFTPSTRPLATITMQLHSFRSEHRHRYLKFSRQPKDVLQGWFSIFNSCKLLFYYSILLKLNTYPIAVPHLSTSEPGKEPPPRHESSQSNTGSVASFLIDRLCPLYLAHSIAEPARSQSSP